MLLLADFIYAIANMITKYDISNGFDIINTRARVCLFEDELFIIEYLQKLNSVNMFIKVNIKECFRLIENLGAEALIISEFFIRYFFKMHSNYNNMFRFFLKQQSYKTYSILVKENVNLSNNVIIMTNFINFILFFYKISQTIDALKSLNVIQEIVQNDVEFVRYDKLSPTSILIESNILVLISLSITSLFILIFLCVGLKRQMWKLKDRKKRKYHYIAKNQNQEDKRNKLKIGVSSNSELIRNNEQVKHSITYQNIKKNKKDDNGKNINMPENLNSEVRKLNDESNKKNLGDNFFFDPKENDNNNFFKNANQTLSLSGSIRIEDKNNDIDENDMPYAMKRVRKNFDLKGNKLEEVQKL